MIFRPHASKALFGLVVLAAGIIPPMSAQCAQASGRVSIVVMSSTSSIHDFCVPLQQKAASSGIDVLRETGLSLETKSYGGLGEFVCRIGAVGPASADCPGSGGYWGYFLLHNNRWEPSKFGASSVRVADGDAQAWVWEPPGKSVLPPIAGIGKICAAGPHLAKPVRHRQSMFGLFVAAGVITAFVAGTLLTNRRYNALLR